jgi:hypothetical protein
LVTDHQLGNVQYRQRRDDNFQSAEQLLDRAQPRDWRARTVVPGTNDIRNDDFMAGKYNFTIPGNPAASIVNLGSITATSGGFAALMGPGVRNSGIITATLGTVSLAAGTASTLDLRRRRSIR